MNSKLDDIYSRRSIRKYTDQKISDDLINDLMEAAMAAPSANAQDPWRFIVVTDKVKLEETADLLEYGKMLNGAPLGIIVCGDQSAATGGELSYMVQDCSAAIENILVAANILGLGAVWLGVHPREHRVEGIRNLYEIPDNITPISVISIGYPAQKSAPRTRFDASKVKYNIWD